MIRKGFELVWEHTLDQTNKASTQLSSNQVSEFDLIKSALIKAGEVRGETFVIKLNEDIIDSEVLLNNFVDNISVLKKIGVNIVIVHEHGRLVSETLKYFGIEEKFIEDARVTDHKTAQIIEMVLSGHINKKIVAKLGAKGCPAIGISGKDGNMIEAHNLKVTKKRDEQENIIDIGFIGEPTLINPELLIELEEASVIPVISPVAFGKNGSTYLIDTDLTAAIIASALSAEKLIFFSDRGPLKHGDQIINELNVEELKSLLNKDAIEDKSSGMAEAAVSAIENASSAVYIVDSAKKDSMLLDIFTDARTGSLIKIF